MKKYLFILTAFAVVLMLTGCSKRPAEIPPLYPCSIEVVLGDQPVADAAVSLGGEFPYAMNGITDAQGKAVMKTSFGTWSGEGIPQGTYKVTVVKEPVWSEALTVPQYEALSVTEKDAYNIKADEAQKKLPREFPVKFSSDTTTPLKLECPGNGPVSARFDLKK